MQGIKSNPIGETGDLFTPSENFCMEASLYLQGHGAYARQVIILATDGRLPSQIPKKADRKIIDI